MALHNTDQNIVKKPEDQMLNDKGFHETCRELLREFQSIMNSKINKDRYDFKAFLNPRHYGIRSVFQIYTGITMTFQSTLRIRCGDELPLLKNYIWSLEAFLYAAEFIPRESSDTEEEDLSLRLADSQEE